jgi:HK97 family phage portal protein
MGLLDWFSTKQTNPQAQLIEGLTIEEFASHMQGTGGLMSTAGVNVTPETAMQNITVAICLRVLAESVASLPCILYKRRKDGGKDRADGHPLYRVLHDQANGWNTAFEYAEGTMTNLATRGNGYSLIERNNKGETIGLIPLNPDGVTIEQAADWHPIYTATMPDNSRARLATRDMHHIRGPLPKGYVGRSMIALARDAIGLGLATERFGGQIFSNGAVPSGVLTHPKSLSTGAQERLKTQFAEKQSGASARKPLFLEEGMSWAQTQITPDDAQFLETRKFQRSEVAGIFRVPAHFVNDLEKATFSNIEHQSLDFVIHSLRPWLVRWEQAINRDLLAPGVERETYFAEFLIDALLRGDFKTRMEGYAQAIQNGIFSPNECRIMENRNPRKDGDAYLQPLNMGTADQVQKQFEQKQSAPAPAQEPVKKAV